MTAGEHKPGDPADREVPEDNFGNVHSHATHSHRADHGDDKLMRLIDFLRCHPRATLASGEGALLLAEIDRLTAQPSLPAVFIDQLAQREGELAALERENALLLAEIDRFRAGAKDSADHYADACAEIDRLNAQWERLTNDKAVEAACDAFWGKENWSMSVWRARNRLEMHTSITAARDAARGEK